MHESFIFKQIQRGNRNLVIFSLFWIFFAVAGLIYKNNFFKHLFTSKITPPSEVYELKDEQSSKGKFVRLEANEIFNLFYVEYEQQEGSKSSQTDLAQFWAVMISPSADKNIAAVNTPVEKKILIVKFDIKDPRVKDHLENTEFLELVGKAQRLEGELQPFPTYLKSYANKNFKDLPLVPVMLDTRNQRLDSYLTLGIGVLVLSAGFWGLYLAYRRSKDPSLHPISRAIAKVDTFDVVVNKIEAEMQRPDVNHIGPFTISKSWFFRKYLFGAHVLYLPDLVWVYKQVTQHRHNGIPSGKTYELICWKRDGSKLALHTRKKQSDQVLEALIQKVPYVIYGFSEELKKTWASNRADMIAAIDAQRKPPSPSFAPERPNPEPPQEINNSGYALP